jgi:hypothetical protein
MLADTFCKARLRPIRRFAPPGIPVFYRWLYLSRLDLLSTHPLDLTLIIFRAV